MNDPGHKMHFPVKEGVYREDQMASFYMQQRGIPGSGAQPEFNISPSIPPLSNPNVSFQSSIGGSMSTGSTLPLESLAVSSHGVNVGAPTGAPPAEPLKRKRGRPRKYGSDGAVSLALTTTPSTHPGALTQGPKRGRGRPPGTGKKQQMASLGVGEFMTGSAGMGFTPHVISIANGEDIATKVMAFSQQGPRAICVLSATGIVSTVTLRQPSTSGGSVTYEGHFEILCLSGSYLVTDNGGSRNRTGGLSVSLASPDGCILGGGVAGVLIASGPVQVIVGSFVWGGVKGKNKRKEGSEDHQGVVHNPVAMNSSISPNQNMTSSSSLSPWPAPRQLDMRNSSHVDIDLMRG